MFLYCFVYCKSFLCSVIFARVSLINWERWNTQLNYDDDDDDDDVDVDVDDDDDDADDGINGNATDNVKSVMMM